MPLVTTKSKKLFLAQRSKSTSQGHLPQCYSKGHHKLSMHAKYEACISLYGSKVTANVKVYNRQTNRQDKNNIPLIIRSGGIKNIIIENKG